MKKKMAKLIATQRKKQKAAEAPIAPFTGFPKEGIRFLKKLDRNNEREWFLEHKEEYERYLLEPSKSFVEALRPYLRKVSPHLVIQPKMGGSISRIYRDTRFTNDKSPYKTYVSFLFWDKRGDRVSSPAFYMGLDWTGVSMGCGVWQFTKLQRDLFRDRITTPGTAEEFRKMVKTMQRSAKDFELRGKELKRIPRGFDPEHFNADFLMHNGLMASKEEDPSADIHTAKFAARIGKQLLSTKPVFDWIYQLNQSAALRGPAFLDQLRDEMD